MRLLLFFLVFIPQYVLANVLFCKTTINNQLVLSEKVQTIPNKKISAGKNDVVSVYVTESKRKEYLLEAYVAPYEIRIYNQITAENKASKLNLSLWGRSLMLDITCEPQIF